MGRAGFWRRAFAALFDLAVAELLLQLLAATCFAISGGHVSSGTAFYVVCRPAESIPAGMVLPHAYAIGDQQVCVSSLFGAVTRVTFVARAPLSATLPPIATTVRPDGSEATRVFDLDGLLAAIFVLTRWLFDRFAGGTPGRRLARIAVADPQCAETGGAIRWTLARRYGRFSWPYLPATAIIMLASGVAAATGTVPAALAALVPVASLMPGVSQIAAALAIRRRDDAFYDAAGGTAVATRTEILFARGTATDVGPTPGPGPIADLAQALAGAARRLPWLSLALVAAMAAVYAGELLLPWSPALPASVAPDTLVAWGGADRELAVMLVQPYRLLTSIVLHGSAGHLAANAVGLSTAGWLLERRLGPTLYGGLFVLCGLAGAAASVAFNTPQLVTVGASGAVLGLIAAALPIGLAAPDGDARRWLIAWPLTVCIPAILPTALLPGALTVDRIDHMGGEAAGLALGIAIAALKLGSGRWPSRRAGAAVAAITLVALVAAMPVGGVRAPVQSFRLASPSELPGDQDLPVSAAVALAQRYPDDPRVLDLLAQAEVRARHPAEALQDADRALTAVRRLSPANANSFGYALHSALGSRFDEVGDLERTIDQYTLALADQADGVAALRQRGIAEFHAGQTDAALHDLDAAVAVRPIDAYAALWDDIVAVRAGAHDRGDLLEEAIAGPAWPAPLLHLYRGDIDPEAVDVAVAEPGPVPEPDRRCEADFYGGERLALSGRRSEARAAIEAAARECPSTFIESAAAREELAGHGILPAE